MMSLITALIVSILINISVFLIAYLYRTDKLTDISYALTFITIATVALITGRYQLSNIVLTLMIVTWALRLGSYLLIRINKTKKDKRFDQIRQKFWRFGGFWLLQGFTVWVILIPTIMYLGESHNKLSLVYFVGFFIWLTGLIIEAASDNQKFKFINNPSNKGKWIEKGLWKYSRHPNYFGEILLWFGIYIYTIPGLNPVQTLIGTISPLYIALLIIFVSGIPLLEKKADNKWGSDADYQKYKKRTSILLPLPPKNV